MKHFRHPTITLFVMQKYRKAICHGIERSKEAMIDILTQTMTLVEFGLQVISLSVLQYKITSIPSLLHPEEKSSLQLGAAGVSHGTRS